MEQTLTIEDNWHGAQHPTLHFFNQKQIAMKNELTISNLIIKRFNQLAKPANLKERNEKEALAALTYCEIEFDDYGNIEAYVCFNDNGLWFSYKVYFIDVIRHFYDVNNGQVLVDLDIEGNRGQWVDICDVEIDNHDVLTYLIGDNLMDDYYQVTNEMGGGVRCGCLTY